MKKEDFDKRICDIVPNASNEETYREFLVNSIHYFYGDDAMIPDFDNLSEGVLNDMIDDMNMLWEK